MASRSWIFGVAGLVVGFVLGAAFWYLASPLWIDHVVSEGAGVAAMAEPVASGTFVDADRAHSGTGTATLFRVAESVHVLRLTDFEVTNGPDLEVWLSAHPGPQSSADVRDNDWVSLGPLKGNIGDQNYDIPADVDIDRYQSVVIWCEQFSVLFSPAALAR
ncbi:MAG: DM13 domain-containing protein [Inquilinaceae bacterium]